MILDQAIRACSLARLCCLLLYLRPATAATKPASRGPVFLPIPPPSRFGGAQTGQEFKTLTSEICDPVKDGVALAGMAPGSDSLGSCSPRHAAGRCCFLDLPAELRVAIYELLFRVSSTIVINPTNRQLSMYEMEFRRVPGAQVAVFDPESSFTRLPVAFLATCWQINQEGNEILYGQNVFFMEHIIPFGHDQDPYLGGYIAHNFLLWHLRHSTLSLIRSIGFTASCRCGAVAIVHSEDKTRWTTDGATLCLALFPPGPIDNALHQGQMLAAPERLREIFSSINRHVITHLGWDQHYEQGHAFKCRKCKKWTF